MSDNYNPSQEERNMAMFCHFAAFAGFIIPFGNVLGPLIIWLLKRDDSEYINYHGKEAVNFQITMLIAFMISLILIVIVIGIPLLFGLAIFQLVMVIIAGIKASEGIYYRYPFSLKLVN
ncbi:DUF4870 domain-containing protein [Aliikangiella marina]|uniref:DUF4870 domain-containing protein n=1 Tax=Aliikangiella marina TaxID=1712262 RepID=A0A545TCC8_9GAMM|nr:DUF4870 domain-containing protein [Aliikangiella marina]TQV74874.1 DUF4870 domain-containing protein [Aliikangiella marina]